MHLTWQTKFLILCFDLLWYTNVWNGKEKNSIIIWVSFSVVFKQGCNEANLYFFFLVLYYCKYSCRFPPKGKIRWVGKFCEFLSNMDFSTSWGAISLRHFSMHGACLGSDSLFVFSPILAIACVSLGLSGIFDVRIIQQVLKSENVTKISMTCLRCQIFIFWRQITSIMQHSLHWFQDTWR